MHLGMAEVLGLLAVALLLFGPKKLPELAKGLGEGIRNFRSSLNGESNATTTTTPEEKK